MSDPSSVAIDAALVRGLLADQFPQWAELPIHPIDAAGTDNAMFRLGPDLAVRLPRVRWALDHTAKEQAWLPRLAPLLPCPVPEPLGIGRPTEAWPWNWTVCRWISGETATAGLLPDETSLARDLAAFVAALRRIDPTHGPPPGRHNFHRGAPLATRDQRTRAAIANVADLFDPIRLSAAWDAALAAPAAPVPTWIHGDLQGSNLLVNRGRLCGVIDFGGLGVGDPACDLIVAWNLFGSAARGVYCAELMCGDSEWTRGFGWALSSAAIAFESYRVSHPVVAGQAHRTLCEVLTAAAP